MLEYTSTPKEKWQLQFAKVVPFYTAVGLGHSFNLGPTAVQLAYVNTNCKS